MAEERTYTYRAGERVDLTKAEDSFVVRALPADARELGLEPVEQVSSSSTKVTCAPEELDEVMDRTRRETVAHHVYRTDDGAELLITDRVYVRFQADVDADALATFAVDYALVLLEEMSPGERLYQLTDATGMNPVKLVQRLTEDDDRVLLAENDVNYRTEKAFNLPSDTKYQAQWHLHRLSTSPRFDPRSSARCDEAWQLLESFGSTEVVVAITDDGCRLDHGDFNSQGKFSGWGYFEGARLVTDGDVDADATRMYESGSDHGTSCAGVAAGEADGVLTVGAAPGCRLLPIKWESEGDSLFISDSKLRKALDYISDRADVMSNSWGHVPVNNVGAQVTSRITQLSSSGGRRGTGIVFLWAAGNENCPINHTAGQPVPYDDGWAQQGGQWVFVGPETATVFRNNLTDLPGVLHVGALGSTARRSHYSNYGPGVDICAPTNNNHTYLGESLGLGVTATKGTTPTSTTASFGGTSSATPLVAGIAALVISANPELTAGEVISVLQRSASKDLDFTAWPKTPSNASMSDTSWDVSPVAPFDSGAFTNTGHADGTWSPWFGFGRVDAFAAVTLARGTPTPAVEPVVWEQTLQGSLGATGQRRSWTVNFSGTMRVELKGPANVDFDLHLQREVPASPSASSKGTGPSSQETVEVAALSPERWRITVVSWQGAGDFTLKVRVSS